jgi:hypothetical protein
MISANKLVGTAVASVRAFFDPYMPDRAYHFLIRVRGSTETFHFQVTARNRFVALKQARLIPNLVECRAISGEELEGLLNNERGESGPEAPK